jgi:hypothetical protein
MPLETGTLISDLVVTNPAHADGLNQADAHIRLLKAALKNTFPNINSAVSLTDEQLNALLTGFTAADGSNTAPTHNFASEPTLGLYRPSAGHLGFTGRLVGNGASRPGAVHLFLVEPSSLGKGGTGTGFEFLELDGSTWNISAFPDLALALGVTTGTTFTLPAMTDTGRFPRSRTSSVAAGAAQANQNKTHTHTGSGTTSADSNDHSHGFSGSTAYMNQNQSHSHSYSTSNGGSVLGNGGGSGGVGGGGAFGVPISLTINATNTDHTHNFGGNTGGVSAFHQHTYSFTTSAGSADGAEARPEALTFIFAIKT